MSCDDAELLLAAHAVGSLDAHDESALRHHLGGCADCRVLGGVLLHVGTMIAETAPPAIPPPTLRRSLMAQVEAEARARAGTDGAVAPVVRTASRWHRRAWAHVPAGRPFTVGAGLAAAAASLLAAWSFGTPHPSGALALRLATCGSAGVPATRCALDYEPTLHQAVLTVAGLPDPAVLGGVSAQTYEVWLIPTHGAPLPTAFLGDRPGGRGWSAAISGDLRGDAAIAVTAEPLGGSPAPTGPEVLRVALPPGT
jgi:anti-sigma-K factor RskA